MFHNPTPVCAIIVLTACSGVAQSTSAPVDSEVPRGPRVVGMTFSPAPAPVPALKYLLMPSLADRNPGSTEAMYRIAAQLCDQLRYSAESEALFERVPDWVDMPLDELPREQVDEALNKASHALHYAALGARREWCQWDVLSRTDGWFNALLPELGPLRTIGRLLAIRARIAIAEGRYPDAMDDLQTLASMAHCVGEAPTLIHSLVGAAQVRLLASDLESWIKQTGSPNLYWALTELPQPLAGARAGLQMERCWLYVDFPDLRKLDTVVMSPEQIRAIHDGMVAMLLSSNHDGSAKAAAEGKAKWDKAVAKNHKQARDLLLSAGYDEAFVKAISPEQAILLQLFNDYRELSDELFKLFALPYWRAHAELGRIEQRIEKDVSALRQEYGSGLFKEVVPSLSRAVFLLARADRDITILRVIEAIRLYAAGHDGQLPPTLDAITTVFVPEDPITGKPFVYEYAGDHATLIGRVPAGYEESEVRFHLRVRE